MKDYIVYLYQEVPEVVYECLLFFLVVVFFLSITIKGLKKGFRIGCCVFFLCYLSLLFASTVFHRSYAENRGHNFNLFWSYSAIVEGQEEYMAENLLNVFAFIPIGFCLGMILRTAKWWKVLGIGILISASIELLQYFLKRGFAEFDDVFHNVLGCLIGYGLYKVVECLNNRIKRKNLLGV